MIITEEQLIAVGYQKYQPGVIKPYCDFLYQRRITDEEGTRYFNAFWHYPPYEVHGHQEPGTWLFELSLNEPHSTFEIHRPATIPFCELKAEEFWRMMGAVYYERNETTT